MSNLDDYYAKYGRSKPKTNADYVRQMNDDEINEWYWRMLHYVKGYTDSRVALREWLKKEYKKEL